MAELAQKAATIADLVVKTAAMAVVVFVMSSVTIYLKRWDLSKRLSTLEEYRSKYKSLPDTITFRKIVKKPKEVRKLLEESEQEIARHDRL
jgi:hypothetical protein